MHHLQKLLVCCFGVLAVCTATYHLKTVFVNDDGSNIVVMARDGRAIHILNNKTESQSQGQATRGQKIEIQVTGPNEMTKTVRIDDYKGDDGKYQSNTIAEIFHGFQGTIDSATYEKLMDTVEKHVQDKKIHPNVLHALQFLDMEKYDMKDNVFYKMKIQEIVKDQMMGSGSTVGREMDVDMMTQHRKPFDYNQELPEYLYKKMLINNQYPSHYMAQQKQQQYKGMEYPYYTMGDQSVMPGRGKDIMMGKNMMMKEATSDDLGLYDLMGQKSYLPHLHSGQQMYQDKQIGDYYSMMKGDDVYGHQRPLLHKALFNAPEQEHMYSRGYGHLMDNVGQQYGRNQAYNDQMHYQDTMGERSVMQRPHQYYSVYPTHGINDYMSQGMSDNSYMTTRGIRKTQGEKAYMKTSDVDDTMAY